MKNQHSIRGILILTVACAAVAGGAFIPAGASAAGKKVAAAPAPQTQGAGRLVIVRSASLGAYAVGLSVDGKQTATINFNGRYDAPLSAGPHVLAVIPVPNRQAGKATETKVTVEPGKTYSFTAKRSNDDYILK